MCIAYADSRIPPCRVCRLFCNTRLGINESRSKRLQQNMLKDFYVSICILPIVQFPHHNQNHFPHLNLIKWCFRKSPIWRSRHTMPRECYLFFSLKYLDAQLIILLLGVPFPLLKSFTNTKFSTLLTKPSWE